MINIHGPIYPHELVCNKTLNWFGMDSIELLEYNLRNRRSLLVKHNWIDKTITYKFNKHGFRGDDFSEDPSIMFLGCSHTFGLGVPLESSWTYRVASALQLKHVNLGWPATSNDTAFRYAYTYLQKVKPKIVVLLSPSVSRTDLIVKDKFVTFLPAAPAPTTDTLETRYNEFYDAWLSSDLNIELNRVKNALAIKQLCEQQQIKFVSHNWENFKFTDLARDLLHFGINTHENVSEVILNLIGTP